MSLHAMLDIETLGKGPKAVVLSASVVVFNPEFHEVRNTTVYFNVKEQIAKGRAIDPGTVAWWMNQDVKARQEAFCQPQTLCIFALSELRRAFEHCDTVWAKSPQFDCTIMESLYEDFEEKVPWTYRALRDVRTTVKLASVANGYTAPENTGVEHNPLDDCRYQCRELAYALDVLGLTGKVP